MKEILTYAAQVSVLSLCAYLVYKTVFARDTLHRVRRFVLLGLLAASFALPVCRITVVKEIAATGIVETVAADGTAVVWSDIPAFDAPRESQAAPVRPGRDPWLAAGIVYLAGVCALLAYRLAGIVRVRRIMRRTVGRTTTDDGLEVLLVEDDIPPFSFEGRIVLSENDRRSGGAGMILRHEAVHIRERHGVDLSVVNLAAALLWFDPFVWLLRRELILVHEIAADSGVIQSGIDAKKYQYLLISKIVRTEGLLPVASHFRTSDLRKRIMTMNRKTSRAAALKTLLLLPLAALALVAFAQTRYVAAETTARLPDEPENETAAEAAPGTTEPKYYAPGKAEIFKGDVKVRESSLYGKHIHPVTGEEIFHSGIDFIPGGNDTLFSPLPGVVKSAAFDGDYGNRLVISNPDGLETAFAHLASFLVAEGETVKGGQPIAVVGNTGKSAGKHLHLETRVDGELVDPMKALYNAKPGQAGTTGETTVYEVIRQ